MTTCKHCDEPNLTWFNTDSGWRLVSSVKEQNNEITGIAHVCLTHIKALRANKVTFEVLAGKVETNDDGSTERNYKYIDLFDDYNLAVQAHNSCDDYQFRELHIVQYGQHNIIKD